MMPTRYELTARLETVTPLFLSGAEPRGAPELRPPSFRGALRYWLRAALGGVMNGDLDAVRKAEAAVFGSADEKSAAASAVLVRVTGDQQTQPRPYQSPGQTSGRAYLFWSMAGSRTEASARFYLQLHVRPGVADPQRRLSEATAALWLLVNLGGIGARSRRGGGSLSVIEVSGETLQPLVIRGSTCQEIANQLGEGLTRIRRALSAGALEDLNTQPAFDVLQPRWCRVWALGVWSSSDQALDEIGNALRGFRLGSQISAAERAVFGLPLPRVQVSSGGDKIDRRASPLWLKVSKSAGGAYFGVATLFKSQFLPPNAGLNADYDLVERFIREKFPQAQEIKYA